MKRKQPELRFDAEKSLWVCDACGLCYRAKFVHACVGENLSARVEKLRADPPKPPPDRQLTLAGKALLLIAPGDAAAWLIKYSGAKAAAEWAKIIEQDCPTCTERQAWLNHQWQAFVWEHFSEAIDPAAGGA